ncbi:MAG: hypothetical protein Q4E91_10965 [Lachnospiraceae bacterium]|nr:hypothetical protein [Lachnospiraceae bacterium]
MPETLRDRINADSGKKLMINAGNNSAQGFALAAKPVRTSDGWKETNLFAEGEL